VVRPSAIELDAFWRQTGFVHDRWEKETGMGLVGSAEKIGARESSMLVVAPLVRCDEHRNSGYGPRNYAIFKSATLRRQP
jgi:hypothetical protein